MSTPAWKCAPIGRAPRLTTDVSICATSTAAQRVGSVSHWRVGWISASGIETSMAIAPQTSATRRGRVVRRPRPRREDPKTLTPRPRPAMPRLDRANSSPRRSAWGRVSRNAVRRRLVTPLARFPRRAADAERPPRAERAARRRRRTAAARVRLSRSAAKNWATPCDNCAWRGLPAWPIMIYSPAKAFDVERDGRQPAR